MPRSASSKGSGVRMTADERRRAVVVAAVREFAVAGFAGTSTETIAARAGISQPYLFRLFASKRELFLAAVDEAFDRVEVTLAAASEGLSGEEALDSMAGAYTELIADRDLLQLQLHAYAACSDPEVAAVVRRRYERLVVFVAEHAVVDTEDLAPFFAAGMLCNVVAALGFKDLCELWPGDPDVPRLPLLRGSAVAAVSASAAGRRAGAVASAAAAAAAGSAAVGAAGRPRSPLPEPSRPAG